jgi:hypothetical protein
MSLWFKQIIKMSTAFLVLAAAPAWAHPVSVHTRTTSVHDRGPQTHDHGPATRQGR